MWIKTMRVHLQKYLLSLLLLTVTLLSSGQIVDVSLGINYGTYRMSDPKTFQSQTLSVMPPHSQVIANFPGYVGYDLQVYFRTSSRLKMGLFYGFSSTGGRTNYTDYSGTYYVNEFTHCHQLGSGAEYLLSDNPASSFKIYLSARVGAIITSYSVHANLSLVNLQVFDQIVDFKAVSLLVSPGIVLSQNITKSIFIKGEIRYLLDTCGELKDPDGNALLIRGNSGASKVNTDWSGIRAGLMVGIRF